MSDKYNVLGLSEKDAQDSRNKYGANELRKKNSKSFFSKFVSNLSDPIIRILIVALSINIVFMLEGFDIIESVGIAVTILISTLVSTVSELGSEKAFNKLDREFENIKVKVYRDGRLKVLKSTDIVVNDVVLVNSGDKIAADGLIMQGEITVDQSALTGETKEIHKKVGDTENFSSDNPSALFCGSLATSGECLMRVTAVGDNTYYGKTAKDLTSESPSSPLKEKLTKLAKQISHIGYFGAALVAFFYLFNNLIVKNQFDPTLIFATIKNIKVFSSILIKCLTMAITIVVVAVPEGLPMMITVVLSSNMKRMMKDNILIKKLVGIETAGSMNLLFCDKTGTVTTGKQTLNSMILGNCCEKSVGSLKRSNNALFKMLWLNAYYNTDCKISENKLIGGNPTDRAITSAFIGPYHTEKYHVLSKIYFNSIRKYSAVNIIGKKEFSFYKGAPDKLLKYCTEYMDENGAIKTLDHEAIISKIKENERNCKRLCLIALSTEPFSDAGIPNLTLLALAVISDPLRNGVIKAVKEIQGAGVHIIMITGDSPSTAVAIAKSTGICNDKYHVILSGDELHQMSDGEVKKILPKLSVISRVLPSDKRRLVRLAQECGLVTGMTGDGINDSSALKLADIGFAMGSGTEVAKEAGDVVIINNDLKSIGKCMLYGRTIFESIRKFVVFQLTMNFCAVAVTILGPILGVETPITMIQMLWINIIMDTLGALAFASEAPLKDTMQQKPKSRSVNLLSRSMISKILINGGFTVFLCVGFMIFPSFNKSFIGDTGTVKLLSGLFCLFVFCGIINSFAARSVRLNLFSGLFDNKNFIIIMGIVAFVQLLMLYFGNEIFRTTPLDISELFTIIMISLMIIPIDFIRKILFKKVFKKYT